jgi:hypothetical protein
VAKSSFKKFVATIANASLLSDLELQREQELAEANLSGRRHGEKTSGGIIRSAGCGDLARGSRDRHATELNIEPV